MRLRAPTSKTQHRAKLAPFDVLWAIAAPFLALALRDPVILEQSDGFGDFGPAYQYAFTTMFFAFVSFLVFRISDGMSHLFSVNDVLAICGAVTTTVASSSLTLFVLTRMEGVPRSTPLIYALVLGAGLVVARTMARVSNVGASAAESPRKRRASRRGVCGACFSSASIASLLRRSSSCIANARARRSSSRRLIRACTFTAAR